VKAGDTFFLTDRAVDTHLWVVISDPAKDSERVVLVSVTTFEPHKEAVCLLDVGDHPTISHKSCIAYNEARMTALGTLIGLRDGGHMSPQAPVSTELLMRTQKDMQVSLTRVVGPGNVGGSSQESPHDDAGRRSG
jgi:hypothetical protein